MSPRHRKHTARHRKPTASAKKVAKIAFTGAEFQRADHGGSGGRSAGAHAGCPPSAGPVNAQYVVRAGALAVALGLGAAVTNTPAVAFAEPTDTGSSSSSPGSGADGSGADGSGAGVLAGFESGSESYD